MESQKMNDFNERIAERMISGIAGAIVVAVGIVAIGTVLTPAVLAYLFRDWRWMIVYPCCFAMCALLAARKKH